MNRSKELLSAHLDGALSDEEALELAELWATEPELAVDARRYQALGESLRAHAGSAALQPGVCLTARVRASIESDPAMEAVDDTERQTVQPATVIEMPTRRRPTGRLMTALAMAASVAAVAVLGVGGLRLVAEADPQPSVEIVETAVVPPAPAASGADVVPVSAATNHWSTPTGTQSQVLRVYYDTHSQVTRSGPVRVINASSAARH